MTEKSDKENKANRSTLLHQIFKIDKENNPMPKSIVQKILEKLQTVFKDTA